MCSLFQKKKKKKLELKLEVDSHLKVKIDKILLKLFTIHYKTCSIHVESQKLIIQHWK